jgi:hypothetical protein
MQIRTTALKQRHSFGLLVSVGHQKQTPLFFPVW